MYGNPYVNNFNQQSNIDRINNQIAELEKMKTQMQQPATNLTQNFQLAPNRDVIRYASSMDEVNKDIVYGDTPYFSKDMSVVWIKNTKGEIKTYELNEIIPRDEKDMKIEYLQAEIEELKKGVLNNEPVANIDGSITNTDKSKKSSSVSKSTRVNTKSR